MRQCSSLTHSPAGSPRSALCAVQGLEAEELDSLLLEPAAVPATRIAAPEAPALPSVPTAAVKPRPQPAQKTPEELELEALQAEMAG
jgi:hypothetical protein